MRALVLSLLLASCSGSTESAGPTADGDVVDGEVVAVDLSPMAYDGSATLDLRTPTGVAVRAEVPARTNLCQAQGLGVLGEIRVGDRVSVRGERSASGVVTPCTDAAHYLRVVEMSSPSSVAVRGVVELGFERSAFYPCDRPGVEWWIVPDPDMSDQIVAIREREAPEGGRGLRLFAEVTVVGDLGDASDLAHLGDYAHRLTVTETREVFYLGRDLDTAPACR